MKMLSFFMMSRSCIRGFTPAFVYICRYVSIDRVICIYIYIYKHMDSYAEGQRGADDDGTLSESMSARPVRRPSSPLAVFGDHMKPC